MIRSLGLPVSPRPQSASKGERSHQRRTFFRAGLPQGSILAPTLYTLWSADLIETLRRTDRTEVLMYADDKATLSAGATVELAVARVQQAADALTVWARR